MGTVRVGDDDVMMTIMSSYRIHAGNLYQQQKEIIFTKITVGRLNCYYHAVQNPRTPTPSCY